MDSYPNWLICTDPFWPDSYPHHSLFLSLHAPISTVRHDCFFKTKIALLIISIASGLKISLVNHYRWLCLKAVHYCYCWRIETIETCWILSPPGSLRPFVDHCHCCLLLSCLKFPSIILGHLKCPLLVDNAYLRS